MNTTTKVDRLAELLAQIDALTSEADAIKAELKDEANLTGQKRFDGTLFRATYTETNRSVVDWKGIAAKMRIPAEMIAAHTKTTAVFSLRMSSK